MNMDYEKRVSVYRGDVEESIHFGAAAVMNSSGDLVHSIGNPELVTFPRSALKFLQGIALIETGAADAYDLDNRHLSLACASHMGEPFHIELVNEWLELIGLSTDALACGPDYPLDQESCHNRLRNNENRNSVFHNCSGKHTAFLTVCQHLGFNPRGYNQLDHPVQQLFQQNLNYFIQSDSDRLNWQVDGCTFPAPAMKLKDMAQAMARFVDHDNLDKPKSQASQRLQQAIAEYPQYMSGTHELAAHLANATNGRVLSKIGAEGYHIAIDREQKLGMALKIADGSVRGINFLLISLLDELDLLNNDEREKLNEFLRPRVLNSYQEVVGHIESA